MNTKSNNIEKCDLALQALYDVDDPEIGLNIVDLGLVYEIYFDEVDEKVVCIMTLTTQFCPMGDAITTDTRNALSKTFPGWDITLNLTFDPAWNFSMISPEGLVFLGQG